MKNEDKLLDLLGAICERLDKLITLLEPAPPTRGTPPPSGLGATLVPMYGVRMLPRREKELKP